MPQGVVLNRSFYRAHIVRGRIYAATHQHAQAIEACVTALRRRGASRELLGTLGFSHAGAGETDRAHVLLDELRSTRPHHPRSGTSMKILAMITVYAIPLDPSARSISRFARLSALPVSIRAGGLGGATASVRVPRIPAIASPPSVVCRVNSRHRRGVTDPVRRNRPRPSAEASDRDARHRARSRATPA